MLKIHGELVAGRAISVIVLQYNTRKADTEMTLGERIAYYRGTLGLSQGELAEKLGVSRQAVSKWETDAGLPDLDRLIALSGLYSITLDELVKGHALPSCRSLRQSRRRRPLKRRRQQKRLQAPPVRKRWDISCWGWGCCVRCWRCF